jgi:SEC-C motif
VFSASLSAYTISHGSEKPSSGPDLLLSYHDNDHYNSVRLTTPPRLPPPIRTFVRPDSLATNGVDETKARARSSDMSPFPPAAASLEAQRDTNAPLATRQLTRHAVCPCGSGKRYRKCCYASERRELNVSSTALGSDFLVQDVEDDIDGTFRILRI